MKTFIMILTLLFTSLLADEEPIITEVLSYQTDISPLSIENIKEHDAKFKKLDANSTFTSPQWLRITLRDDLESGKYIVSYGDFDFDLSSFSPEQEVQEFMLYGDKKLSFMYKKTRDSKVYYIHVLPTDVTYLFYIDIQSETDFFNDIDRFFIYLLLIGVVLGLIMMTAIYNGALYYFNREHAFLYYALMQIFMVGVLLFHSGMPHARSTYFITTPYIYDYLSLFTVFFAVLFTRSFLNTKEYLPSHDKILLLFLALIMIDIFYYPKPIIADFNLYSLTTMYFLVVGYLRMQQGYKPARFFVIGWTSLVLGILILEHFEEYAYFDTMLLGSTIEAIMLALALSYKIRQIQAQQEEQKELMIHQSKLASMGEMIGNIAHQWRQPLTHLSYIFMNIEELDERQERSKKVAEGTKQLEFMSQTIDDFKDFYAPSSEKETFDIATEITSVLELMHFESIMIDFKKDESVEVYNYKNQFKQVLLNLLTNAKEALQENTIKDPRISIMIENQTIIIADNAGGIKKEHLDKIFEPYFSTKEKSTGIGLYMSKMIVEKNMGGSLTVKNTNIGATFKLMIDS